MINGDGPILALDIGSTRITGGLVTAAGEVLLLRHLSTLAQEGAEAVIQRAITLLQELYKESGAMAPRAIGISTTGFIQSTNGAAAFATTAVPGWQNLPMSERVGEVLRLPTFVDNDAHLMTLGEARFGAGRDYRHLVGVSVGAGIRGGLVIDGRLYHGASDAAGAIGHMVIDYQERRQCACGRYGCLEIYTNVPQIIADFVRRMGRNRVRRELGLDPRQVGVNEIADLARGGQADALAALESSTSFLGVGIAALLNLLNPEAVIIGGEVTQFGEIYLSLLRQVVQRRALSTVAETQLLLAQLGLQANLLGAASLARHCLSGAERSAPAPAARL